MSTKTLKFYVREDGNDFAVCDMTEPEGAAIAECVSDLVPSKYQFTSIWFEADTCIIDDEDGNSIEEDDDYEEPKYGLLRCFRHNTKPNNGSLGASRLPTSIPQDVLDHLAGKTFTVRPNQYGLNPWGAKVEVIFEAAPPAPAPAPAPIKTIVVQVNTSSKPIAGIRASDLIAAALKAQ